MPSGFIGVTFPCGAAPDVCCCGGAVCCCWGAALWSPLTGKDCTPAPEPVPPGAIPPASCGAACCCGAACWGCCAASAPPPNACHCCCPSCCMPCEILLFSFAARSAAPN